MARGWFGAGILVVFLVLGLVVSGIMDRAHLPTGAMLEQAAEKALSGALEEGAALGMAAKARWQRQWNGTATVADHTPMDDVDALFAQLEIYAQAGEAPHFAACCKELSQRFVALAEAHTFNLWNILVYLPGNLSF